ncbi:hypothetical protein [Streptomyces sp. NPDC002386]
MTILRNQAPSGTRPDAPIRIRHDTWSVRVSQASRGRPALEVYVGASLADVVVPTALVTGALRGACSVVADGRPPVSLAWGVLGATGAELPRVLFGRRRWTGRHLHRAGATVPVGGGFWISAAEGRFAGVAVTRADGSVEHLAVPARRGETVREGGAEHGRAEAAGV